MTQLAFDFNTDKRTNHPNSLCPGDCTTHILMPNMAWACGGSIITKGGHIGWLHTYDKVTCPDCLSEGFQETQRRQRAQLGQCRDCGTRLNKRDQCPEGCA